MAFNKKKVIKAAELLLEGIGEDLNREGIKDTPKRYANWWDEFINYQPGKVDTTFSTLNSDQLVIVKDMRVWSLCEHHLLPFYADISIGYLSKNKVLGLSKFARIAHKYANHLQIQEQLVEQIASKIIKILGTEDVAVIAHGEHLCMTMRGIKTQSKMISSSMHGKFRHLSDLRAEFLNLCQ